MQAASTVTHYPRFHRRKILCTQTEQFLALILHLTAKQKPWKTSEQHIQQFLHFYSILTESTWVIQTEIEINDSMGPI